MRGKLALASMSTPWALSGRCLWASFLETRKFCWTCYHISSQMRLMKQYFFKVQLWSTKLTSPSWMMKWSQYRNDSTFNSDNNWHFFPASVMRKGLFWNRGSSRRTERPESFPSTDWFKPLLSATNPKSRENDTSTQPCAWSVGAFQILGVKILVIKLAHGGSAKSAFLTFTIWLISMQDTILSLKTHSSMESCSWGVAGTSLLPWFFGLC